MSPGRSVWLAIPVVAALGGASSRADTVTLAALKDNTLYQNDFGSTSNGMGQYIFCGTTAFGAEIRRAVIAFDVAAAVPAGSTINSVTLTLRMSKTIVGAEVCTLRRLTSDWGEGASNAPDQEGAGDAAAPGDATWLHTFYDTEFWTTPGGDFVSTVTSSVSVSGTGFYTWPSTPQFVADVQDMLDHPATNYGWILRGNEATNPTAKRFDSRHHPTVNNRPKLTINYTPPPPVVPGDMDCDNVLDIDDVSPFVLALTDPDAYADAFPTCDILRGDFDDNGAVDGDDIEGFVQALIP